MQLATLATELKTPLLSDDVSFSGVSIDTRTLTQGDLFFAFRGEHDDAHQFISEAEHKQAAGVVMQRNVATRLPAIQVPDVTHALGVVGQLNRLKFKGKVVGITGSVGKTTVTMMIASILQQMGSTVVTQGNFNNEIGLPLSLCAIDSEHQYAVLEMGARKTKDIDYLCQLAQPDVSVVTSVAPTHLDTFGSLSDIARTKGEIYNYLDHRGIAVVNLDDDFASQWLAELPECTVITFGNHSEAMIRAENVRLAENDCPCFTLSTPQGQHDIALPLPGQHNVSNALCASAAAYGLGASEEALQQGLQNLSTVPSRLQFLQGQSGSTIIDDAYNANPKATMVAINVLVNQTGEKILVLGDMAELGIDAADYHRQIGEYAKNKGVDRLFAYGQLAEYAAEHFGSNGIVFDSLSALAKKCLSIANEDTVFLIKGSRNLHLEKIVAALSQEGEPLC